MTRGFPTKLYQRLMALLESGRALNLRTLRDVNQLKTPDGRVTYMPQERRAPWSQHPLHPSYIPPLWDVTVDGQVVLTTWPGREGAPFLPGSHWHGYVVFCRAVESLHASTPLAPVAGATT